MDEQRVQAYAQLIDRLLNCPNGQESTILQQNSDLVDEGFFQIANQYAQHLREQGKEQAATSLSNLVVRLSKIANSATSQTKEHSIDFTQLENYSNSDSDYLDFLIKILQAIRSNADQIQIYILFQKNIDKINLKLVQTLENWTNDKLPNLQSRQKQTLGRDIGYFNVLIQQFPLGNRKSNIEIAIAGYKIIFTFTIFYLPI